MWCKASPMDHLSNPYTSEIQQHLSRSLKQVCIWQTNHYANIFHPNSRCEKCLFLNIFSLNTSKIILKTPVVVVFSSKQLKHCFFPNLNQFWNMAAIDQEWLWKIQLFKEIMDDLKIFWCFWNSTRALVHWVIPCKSFILTGILFCVWPFTVFYFCHKCGDLTVSYNCGGRFVCVFWSYFLDWRPC